MLSAIKLLEAQNIYTTAVNIAMKVFEISQHLPHADPDKIGEQMIHYSSNVCHNLLDAWQNRSHPDIFMDKLNCASAEATETQARITLAAEANLIPMEAADKLHKTYETLQEKIAKMLADPSEFTGV